MTQQELLSAIKTKRSFLCIGLDPVLSKLPKHLLKYKNPVLEFNKQLIAATHDLCVAYKPNTAFYECLGLDGWEALQETRKYIPDGIFTIADAKRGDIGNTSTMYADTFFKGTYGNAVFDAVTVAPYMGHDSVQPFFDYDGKWVILLALTSNEGHRDFQLLKDGDAMLHETVIQRAHGWGTPENLMFVVGATHPEAFKRIREIAPQNFLLVPGIGAQGGDLQEVCKYGLNSNCGLLINAGRSVMYAGDGEDFAERAREEAKRLQQEMAAILDAHNL